MPGPGLSTRDTLAGSRDLRVLPADGGQIDKPAAGPVTEDTAGSGCCGRGLHPASSGEGAKEGMVCGTGNGKFLPGSGVEKL